MSKTRHVTFAFRHWQGDKRIDIAETRNDARTPSVMIKVGFETIEITRREMAMGLQALHTAEVSGGDADRWRDIIRTAEGDLVQEMRAAFKCDVAPMATQSHPNAHLLVVAFETVDQAEAAKAALSALLHFHPPITV